VTIVQSFDSLQLTRPPHGYGVSGDPLAMQKFAIAAASATFDLLGSSRVQPIVFMPDVDCYVRIGGSDVAAATTNDFLMSAGWIYKFTHCGDADRYISVIAKSTIGTMKYYLPSGSPASVSA
jgi:hypothetical protein